MAYLSGSRNYVWSTKDVLGQGATGAVYKCRNKRNGDLYAVKTFNKMSYDRPLEVQMREFEVLRKLKHENIVHLHDVEEEATTKSQVLIMDLCTGGSLFSMLDDPENAFGLDETEFLCVLRDVTAGMKHLRDHEIVHRDIKPGNIMRYISDDGRSIYKLIDFGAARELPDEEQFVSLYGTEEYLYPDMYERAVLRRPLTKAFTAYVDLWSIGVTMYHVATGQLPFRPFGGARRNKELMHSITTSKESGVISGVQHSEGGPVTWSRHLPASCRLSKGLKQLVTPLLGRLLESDSQKMFKFDEYFSEVQRIVSKHVIVVFNTVTCTVLRIYVDPSERYQKLQELVADQSDIEISYQRLLYENHDLTTLVSADSQSVSSYPPTCEQNPVFLFNEGNFARYDDLKLLEAAFSVEIPNAPSVGKDGIDLDVDMLYTKNCCAIAHFIERTIRDLIRDQQLLTKAAKMYRLVLAHDIEQTCQTVEHLTSLVKEMGKRVDLLASSHSLLCGAVKELATTKKTAVEPPPSPSVDVFAKQKERFVKFQEQVDLLHRELDDLRRRVIIQPTLDVAWTDVSSCRESDKCLQKMGILSTSLRQSLEAFINDRTLKRLSFNEEQIHKFEKQKVKTNLDKTEDLVRKHCLPNTQTVFCRFQDWYSQVQAVHNHLTEQLKKVGKVMTECTILTAHLDQCQSERSSELEIQLGQLNVRPPPIVHSPSTNIEKNILMSNGGFTFKTRQARNQEANRSLQRALQSMRASEEKTDSMMAILGRNEKYFAAAEQILQQRKSLSSASLQAYSEVDETADTLTST